MFAKLRQVQAAVADYFEERDMPIAGMGAAAVVTCVPLVAGVVTAAVLLTPIGIVSGLTALAACIGIPSALVGAAAAVEGGTVLVKKNIGDDVRNQAGQRVQGSVYDLEYLSAAQSAINHICTHFNVRASAEDNAARDREIAEVIALVEENRARVRVVRPGSLGAGKDKYDFVKTSSSISKSII